MLACTFGWKAPSVSAKPYFFARRRRIDRCTENIYSHIILTLILISFCTLEKKSPRVSCGLAWCCELKNILFVLCTNQLISKFSTPALAQQRILSLTRRLQIWFLWNVNVAHSPSPFNKTKWENGKIIKVKFKSIRKSEKSGLICKLSLYITSPQNADGKFKADKKAGNSQCSQNNDQS